MGGAGGGAMGGRRGGGRAGGGAGGGRGRGGARARALHQTNIRLRAVADISAELSRCRHHLRRHIGGGSRDEQAGWLVAGLGCHDLRMDSSRIM